MLTEEFKKCISNKITTMRTTTLTVNLLRRSQNNKYHK